MAPSLAWKVCAVLPLVLLCVLMSVKVADTFGKDDSEDSSHTQDAGVIPSDDPFSPWPSETPSETEAHKPRKIMSGAPQLAELPGGLNVSEETTLVPDNELGMPPGDIDQTATSAPGPSKKPTKKPTTGPSPSPTPTPDEARERCIASGISAGNIAALAACIADLMDPNG